MPTRKIQVEVLVTGEEISGIKLQPLLLNPKRLVTVGHVKLELRA